MTNTELRQKVEQAALAADTAASQVGMVRDELHEEREWRRRYGRLVGGMWAVVGLLMFVVIVLLGVVLSQQGRIREAAQKAGRSAEILVECTTASVDPEDPHECFEAGTARSRQAVRDINAKVDAVRLLVEDIGCPFQQTSVVCSDWRKRQSAR